MSSSNAISGRALHGAHTAAEPAGPHPVYSARLALQNHQRQLDSDGVMVGVSREALDIVLKHLSETWNELHCCDDVNLSDGLSGGIADLCKQRDFWRFAATVSPAPRPSGEPDEP